MSKVVVVKIFLFLSLSLGTERAKAQKTINEALYKQVATLDSILFTAFNSHDTATFNNFFSKDLEFYHDKGGLTGYKHTADFAKAQSENKTDLKRTLVPGSLEVYPIKDYGAIQVGAHEFCHTENDVPDCGTFKFVHVWKKIGNAWKITRIISYDH